MTGIVEHLLSAPAWVALLVVFALPALESSAFLGFAFPGETAVILGGVYAGQGDLSVVAVAAAAIAGAVAGDAVGYVVGRRWGRWLLDSTFGRFVKVEHLDRAQNALARRGGWSVFLGRFTVVLRVMIPGLAGMSGMAYPKFAVANVSGAVVWGVVMVLIGYVAGNSWHTLAHLVSTAGAVVTVALVVLLVLVYKVRRRRTAAAAALTDRP
ncbi:DedA family protein [Nocardioides panacisoli]|uniref:VTT domain-containing protein n=1 Tax=Nocardioides panacisoli TaxID=627624 RepID=A0ABP7IYW2_9ACTN